jgi:hypothetical protein
MSDNDSRRYHVFVRSTTTVEPTVVRKEVLEVLWDLDCFPLEAPNLVHPTDVGELASKMLDACDYAIYIFDEDNPGIACVESDYAIKVPQLLFSRPRSASSAIPNAESSTVWSTPKDLGAKLFRRMVNAIKEHRREGWVRAGRATAPSADSLAVRIAELERQTEGIHLRPGRGIEQLQGGDDVFDVRFRVEHSSGKREDVSLSMTWDRIIKLLGPRMFEEASEDELASMLKWLCPNASLRNTVVTVCPSSLDTIKAHLKALGLIKPSTRRHRVSDSKKYWALTRVGEEYVTNLCAVRRPMDT